MERLKNKPKITSEDRIQAYARISGDKTFPERAKIGLMSKVVEVGDQKIRKSDLPGALPLVLREFIILQYLQDTKVVPKIDPDSIVVDTNGSGQFIMEKINNGATLEEWLMEYKANKIKLEIMQEILEQTCEAIGTIWQKGVVHCDLHTNNIVVGMEGGGGQMRPIVIDFGISKMPDENFEEIEQDLGIERNQEDIAQFQTEVDIKRQEMDFEQEYKFFRSCVESFVGSEDEILQILDKLAEVAENLTYS